MSDKQWDEKFAGSLDVLDRLAQEAIAEDDAGLTRPLEENLGETDEEQLRERLERLPQYARLRLVRAYSLKLNSQNRRSWHFKIVSPDRVFYSLRSGDDRCEVGVKRENGIVLFWIGSHSDYDQLLKQL